MNLTISLIHVFRVMESTRTNLVVLSIIYLMGVLGSSGLKFLARQEIIFSRPGRVSKPSNDIFTMFRDKLATIKVG